MLKKVKDWLGIEGVKVALEIPEKFDLDKQVIEGRCLISSQSEQFIESLTVVLKEKYTRGRRKSKLIDEYTLGELSIDVDQSISKDQVIEQSFKLTFSQMKSPVENFGDKNFLFRGISGLARILKNAKSDYTLYAELTVKGNKLKPYDKAIIVPD